MWVPMSPRGNSGNMMASFCSWDVDLLKSGQHFRSRSFEYSTLLPKRVALTYVVLVSFVQHAHIMR